MGELRVKVGDLVRTVPLSASTRVGRHWSNDVVLPLAAAPLHWLEIRWRGDHWSWRPLSAAERTRGSGSCEAGQWRSWQGGNGRVRLDGDACSVDVALVADTPPSLLVEQCNLPLRELGRRRFHGSELEELLEMRSDGRVWPLGAELEDGPSLRDGEVFLVDGEPYRLHRPERALETDELTADLSDAAVTLEIDVVGLVATFCFGSREVIVTGECVRVLAVYADARIDQGDGGGEGWLPASVAHEMWLSLGGRSGSPLDRLAWERGKLRTKLAKQGVGGLEGLFDSRRGVCGTEVRLALVPQQISLHRVR